VAAAALALVLGGIGGLLLVPAASGSGPYEPNDSIAAATGPLGGAITYLAGLETQNDEDWFYFYTNGQQQFDVAFTNLTDGCTNLIMSLVDANGEELHYVRPNVNETRHIAYSSPGAAKYYLRVYDLIGETCSYTFRLEPAAAITTVPPPAPAPPAPGAPLPDHSAKACEHARGHVAGLLRKLRRARGVNYRSAIRRDLRRAQAEVRRRCS
jgi:hypothetical protein